MEGLSIERKGGLLVAAYKGELTIDVTQDLRKEILETLEKSGPLRVVLDLSKVFFMDSAGIGFLVSMSSRLKSVGVDFRLYRPSTQIGKTLDLVQLKSYFNIIKSEKELKELL